MEYNKIIAVTGLPGLFELLNSKTDGAIVRSLDDKSTKFVSSRIHNFSHLESIEIYTTRDNVNLLTVLKAMEESSEKLPDDKDNKALKGYFEKVYPEIDFERVFNSDLKKMVKWFSVLKKNDIELKQTEPAEEEEAETAEIVAEAPAEEKAKAKKPAAKKKEEAEEEVKASPAAKAPAAKKAAAEKATTEKAVAAKPAKTAVKAEKAETPKKAAKKDVANADDKPKKVAGKKKTEE